MVAYLKRRDIDDDDTDTSPARTKKPPQPKHALARDMLHGLSPEEFDVEADSAPPLVPDASDWMAA